MGGRTTCRLIPPLRAFGLSLQDSSPASNSVHFLIMTDTTTKMPDFQQATVHGRIAYMEKVEYQGDTFLSVVLAHTMSEQCDARIRFTNKNGLLTAYNNGTVVIGQELTVSGRIKGIRTFYMKDDVLTPLKNPEIQMSVGGYIFGTKPQPKVEAPKAEPTLEEIPF